MRILYEFPRVERPFIELSPDIVSVILRTLSEGWKRALSASNIYPEMSEVPITEHLRDAMRRVLNASGNLCLIVLPGTESRSRPDVMVPDGRTDIPLFHIEVFVRAQEHEPHAIIECKRINGDDARLCREYVREGVDRFVGGKYAGQHAVGFMTGYIVSGTPERAVVGINAVLQHSERAVERLAPCRTDGAHFWQSRHERLTATRPIALYHVFLAFV